MTTTNLLVAFFKPQRSEAVARLRTNGFAFVVVLIATNLLPLPSPWTAFRVAWINANGSANLDVGGIWYGLCVTGASHLDLVPCPTTHVNTELLLFALLSANLFQAVYALQYPPPASPPFTPSRPKSFISPSNLSSSQRRLSGISTVSSNSTDAIISLTQGDG